MPPATPPSSTRIKWNEVTWYSKLGAIILFVGVLPALTFYIGMQYQQVITASQDVPPLSSQTTDTPTGADQINFDNNTPRGLPEFTKSLGEGESIRGPKLAYIRFAKTIETLYSVGTDALQVKHLSNTTSLIKEGPYTYYVESGAQCGACAHAAFNIYYFDFAKGTSTLAFSFPFHTYDQNDTDFTISPDWMTITEYEYETATDPESPSYLDDYYNATTYQWTATKHCFDTQAGVYRECGVKHSVQPPSPRNFTPARQID